MLHIPQISGTRAWPSDNLTSYPGLSCKRLTQSTEIESVYSSLLAFLNIITRDISIAFFTGYTRYVDYSLQLFLFKTEANFQRRINVYQISLLDFLSLRVYCYLPNVSADMSSSLLQVFVELGNLHGTSNYVHYWSTGVTCSDSVSHNRVQVLSIPVLLFACS